MLATTSALARATALIAIASSPAPAQTWSGAQNTNWNIGGNWSGGAPPSASNTGALVGSTAPGGQGAMIGDTYGMSSVVGQLRVGHFSTALLTIQNNSTLTVDGGEFGLFIVGYQAGSNCTLVMQSGSKLVTADIVRIAEYRAFSRQRAMSGANTTWTANGAANLNNNSMTLAGLPLGRNASANLPFAKSVREFFAG